MTALLLALIGASFFAIFSYFFWRVGQYSHLQQICRLLVISLPFERIPSLEIAGANLRLSQILVLLGFWLLGILFLHQDKTLLEKKIHAHSLWLVLFVLSTIPSWFFILDFKRFLVTTVGTILCLGALFLLANFTHKVQERLLELILSFLVVGLFGYYQFFGDLVLDLPTFLTGLRPHYTKSVFGYPRIQATALEPLYFANMLLLPLFWALFAFAGQNWELVKNLQAKLPSWRLFSPLKNIKPQLFLRLLLAFFGLLFLLTLSKAAWLSFALIFVLFLIFSLQRLQIKPLLQYLTQLIFGSSFALLSASFFFPALLQILVRTGNHFWETLTGVAGTSAERLDFLQAALALLPKRILLGIGSGQYGTYAWPRLGFGDKSLIVNNVYVEIWLETGLLSLLFFLILIGLPLIQTFQSLQKKENSWQTPQNLTSLTLIFSLLAAYLQWLTFSPLFIMPIFITLGLLLANQKTSN